MRLVEKLGKVRSFAERVSDGVVREVTPANAISVSRPLIAWYGLESFMDEPVKLSLTLGAAFATDALDGFIARRFGDERGLGGYVDVFADRALELLTMWKFASQGMIHYAIPSIYTTKAMVVDSVRIYRDSKKGDFGNPLKYGGIRSGLRGLVMEL